MDTINVNHPNPTLGLPKKNLYKSSSILGFKRPVLACRNIAFTSHREMLEYATERAFTYAHTFQIVAWGFVNGAPVDAIGFLCFDGDKYLFTPLEHSAADFKAIESGMDACDIVCKINNDFREDAELLLGCRGWRIVDARCENVAKLFSYILFNEMIPLEECYDLAV